MTLGISGWLTRASIRSPLTQLFLLAAFAAGLLALATIPREEEPQIKVPLVDIAVNADGLRGPDAVELITKPLEAIVKGINGVEHVYSQTQDDRALVTARFLVGTSKDDAILRVQAKIRANLDRIPTGISEPLIVGRGINDVAIVTLTLSPKPEAASRWTDANLYQLADKLRTELIKVDDVGLTYVAGGAPPQIRVEPDPERLALFGVTLQQLAAKLQGANRSFLAGNVRDAGAERSVAVGQTLAGMPDIGLLLVTTRNGEPVYVRDVAPVVAGPAPVEHRVWNFAPDAAGTWQRAPAVTVALAKRAGANAAVVAGDILDRVAGLRGRLIPADVQVQVTRDYGATANEKANELLLHLGIATLSIVGLIAVAVGLREAAVTAVVIPVTILLTLFVSGLMGPYMAPIPVNASAAMIFSFFVAVTVAPWLMLRLAGSGRAARGKAAHDEAADGGRFSRLYRRFAGPVIAIEACRPAAKVPPQHLRRTVSAIPRKSSGFRCGGTTTAPSGARCRANSGPGGRRRRPSSAGRGSACGSRCWRLPKGRACSLG